MHICRIFRKSRTYLTIFTRQTYAAAPIAAPSVFKITSSTSHRPRWNHSCAASTATATGCVFGGNTLGNDSPTGTNRNAFISIARSGALHDFQRRTHRVYRPFSLRKAELDFSPAGWIRFELIGEEFAMRRLLLHFKMEKDIFPQPFCPVSTLRIRKRKMYRYCLADITKGLFNGMQVLQQVISQKYRPNQVSVQKPVLHWRSYPGPRLPANG